MAEPSWELEFVESTFGEDLRVAERRKMKLLAADGWELVSVADGVAYFKRPIQKHAAHSGEVASFTKSATDRKSTRLNSSH